MRSVVQRLAGRHLGIVRFMLVQINTFRGYPDVSDDLGVVGYLLNERFVSLLEGLRVTFDIKSFPTLERSILAEALDKSFLAPPLQNELQGACDHLMDVGLLVKAADDMTYSYASPLLRRLVLSALFSSSSRPSEPPDSIEDFVKSALRMLKPEVFKTTLALLTKGVPREDVWQKEFYRVATALLPSNCVLSAEVGSVFARQTGDSVKAVDFYANSNLQWMVEFLVEGSKLKEHLDRFAPQGRYSSIPRKQWLVVDFRVKVNLPSELADHCMYVRVAADFQSATIFLRGKAPEEVKFQGGVVRTLSGL